MHPTLKLTRQQVLDRARSAIGDGRYALGTGGRDPQAPTPFVENCCDCSGFASYCLGMDRYQPGRIAGDWIETTAIAHDAAHDRELFYIPEDPQPGDCFVFPDQTGKGYHRQGHIGIISEVHPSGRVARVIHCSMGNYRAKRAAVLETDPAVFHLHGAVPVRYKGLVP